jgi:[ribosomal protein S5]-alanine N-acetyltransferase
MMHLNVREITLNDIQLIADYWLLSPPEYLQGMGIDLTKMPDRNWFTSMLTEQINTPYKDKKALAVIWEIDGEPIGHSNVNDIVFGQHAFMHLHMWKSSIRKQGLGTQLVQKSLKIYFEKLQLNEVFCEPYAHNPAPNNALPKIGFSFVKQYRTNPSYLTFEQEVNQWKISKEEAERLVGI